MTYEGRHNVISSTIESSFALPSIFSPLRFIEYFCIGLN